MGGLAGGFPAVGVKPSQFTGGRAGRAGFLPRAGTDGVPGWPARPG
jgi:hypothetical protein